MSTNRFSHARAGVHERGGEITAEVAERVGRAVCEFLDARAAGRCVIPETYLVEFSAGERELARRYFAVAEGIPESVALGPRAGD